MKGSLPRFYVLDEENHPIPADISEWGALLQSRRRIVAQTQFACGVFVSTVFLGLNHRHLGAGPPLLFETMIFELSEEGGGNEMWRYSTWDDAETGHAAAVKRVTALIEKAGLAAGVETELGLDGTTTGGDQ